MFSCFLFLLLASLQFHFGIADSLNLETSEERKKLFIDFFSMLKICIFYFILSLHIYSIQRFRNRFMQCRKHVKFFPFLLFDNFFLYFSIWINKDGLNFFLSVCFSIRDPFYFYFLFYLTNIVCPKGMLCLREIVMSLSIHPK